MKNFIPAFCFLFFGIANISAQKWVQMMEDPNVNFYEVQKEFYSYYGSESFQEGSEPRMDGPYSRFKEWEYYMEPRVYPTGIRPDPKIIHREWLKQKSTEQNLRTTANWSFIGPSVIPSNGGGAGKANCVVIDPGNPQNIWIGSSGGGIWKTNDGGNSWSTTTDQQLPTLVIIDLALNPVNTNILFASLLQGVFKSTDGGNTWGPTSLDKTSYRIEMDPSNPDIILSSCVDGMYRTTDGGNTWSQVTTGTSIYERVNDIEFNPGNPNIVYASGYTIILRSTDNGLTWTQTSTGLPSAPFGMYIAVTPANPDYVYALMTSYQSPASGGFYALCRSTDAGLTWTSMSTTPNILGYDVTGASSGGQGAYCMSLAISPVNADEVYAGGINLWKSTDGGVSWAVLSDWVGTNAPYVHADQQDLKFLPGSGSVLYACNDGGINVSTDGGTSWTDLSNGLEVMEFYKLSSAATDEDVIVAGSQDNGTNLSNSSGVSRINFGDGFKCIIDNTDSNTIYTSYQYGALFRTNDGGVTQVSISPSSGQNFYANYSMNPVNSHTLYAAYDDVFKTCDGGDSWTRIATGLYPSSGGAVSIPVVAAPSDTNTIYLGRLTELYRTRDGGATWDTLTSFVTPSAYITGIVVDPTDANKVWITYSGYSSYSAISNERVFKTTDGGDTWINVTYSGLPTVPVNCIVYENGSPDALYVGTDLGVYYLDNTMSHWIPYSTGLPNVRVMDLDIQYASGKLRAATFGRGLWQTDLNIPVVNAIDAGIEFISSPEATVCIDTIYPVVELKNFGSTDLNSVTIEYRVDAGPVNTYTWSGSLPSFNSVSVSLPAIAVSGLSHVLSAYTLQPNSVADINTINDSAVTTFTYPVGNTLPYSEGFEGAVFPPSGMSIYNPDGSVTWQHTTAAAFTGSSSIYIEDMNYYNDGMIDDVELPYFNFMASTPMLTFEYAYQLRADPLPVNYYSDTLVVLVSTDCGISWTTVYKKFDLPLVTTNPTFNANVGFVPASSADWDLESIDLSSFAGNDKVLIKFQNINGRGNNLYLDDINIFDSPLGYESISKPVISVYPNPNNGSFTFSVQHTKPGNELTIYDVFGKIIYSTRLISGSNAIDISNRASGVYFYRVTSDVEEIGNGKLILK
ncbi:MAG: T9SS type A sorting domain-containing protein [Bacteroidetes bacterium]|nr:T9SS type A sorting domain-containing protein [Bacteroidota bacterium]